MTTKMTTRGRVTAPKRVRDALCLRPGSTVEFAVNDAGNVVIRKASATHGRRRDRFEAARGTAQIQWRTEELMALLRGTARQSSLLPLAGCGRGLWGKYSPRALSKLRAEWDR